MEPHTSLSSEFQKQAYITQEINLPKTFSAKFPQSYLASKNNNFLSFLWTLLCSIQLLKLLQPSY